MFHFLGTDTNWSRTVGITNSELAGHVHVLGQSGMGKSTLIEQFVLQRAWRGEGVCFIDPHGTSAERILDRLPSHRVEDVLFLNPACDDFAVGINILEKPDDPNDRGVVASEVMRMFKGIFGDSWGVRLEQVLRNSVLALLEQDKATLLSIRRMLVNKEYRAFVLSRVQNHVVREYWRDEFGSYPDRMVPEVVGSTLNKIDPFISDDRMRRIVGQPKSTFDFRRGMTGRQIVIANLAKSKIGKEQARNLGAMLVTKLVIEAMQRDEAEATENIYPVVIDEIQNVGTDVLSELISESRKGGLALVAVHQFMGQFNRHQEQLREAILGGCRTKILFQLGLEDAETFEKILSEGRPQNDWRSGEIQSLGKYRAIVRSDVQRADIETKEWNMPRGQREAIVKESNASFGKQTQKIEEALDAFYSSKHQLKDGEGMGV